MALPYENTTSGQNAIKDIQKMLKQFGCTKFATGEDFDAYGDSKSTMLRFRVQSKYLSSIACKRHLLVICIFKSRFICDSGSI